MPQKISQIIGKKIEISWKIGMIQYEKSKVPHIWKSFGGAFGEIFLLIQNYSFNIVCSLGKE
jgi:hypothetical protein